MISTQNIDHTGMHMPNAADVPDTRPDQGPVEPRPDDAGAVPGSTPVQTSRGIPTDLTLTCEVPVA